MSAKRNIDGISASADSEPSAEEITTAFSGLVWDAYKDHLEAVRFPYCDTALHEEGNYNPAVLPLTTPKGIGITIHKHVAEAPPKVNIELANGPKVSVGPFEETSPHTGETRIVTREHWVNREGILHFRDQVVPQGSVLPADTGTGFQPGSLEQMIEIIQSALNDSANRKLSDNLGIDSGVCGKQQLNKLIQWFANARPVNQPAT